jgi:membrane fusion protein, heavy metal efflux system
MRRTNNTLLLGGAAAALLVALGAGYGIARLTAQPAAPQVQIEGAVGDAGEKGGQPESEVGGEAAAEEGVVTLTAQQIAASGITVVAVGRGGGAETRVPGRVEPSVDARAAVAASVGGRVERVLVAPGAAVRAGQPLAVLVSGEAATFRAEADAAAANADTARRAFQRDERLLAQGVVARQEVETARAQSLSAEASARAARARAGAAGSPNAAGRVSVTSPIAGVVGSVQIAPGGFVSQGGLVAEVVNPARVELVFNAPPALATQVRAGTPMTVQSPTGTLDATVIGVAAGAGGDGGATVIRARAAGGVLPPAGSAVTGVVVTGGSSGGLTVPSAAVQTVEGATVVFVAVNGGFRAVPVLTGRQAGGRTEIVRGLTGAERVAADAFLLKAELAKGEAEHGH